MDTCQKIAVNLTNPTFGALGPECSTQGQRIMTHVASKTPLETRGTDLRAQQEMVTAFLSHRQSALSVANPVILRRNAIARMTKEASKRTILKTTSHPKSWMKRFSIMASTRASISKNIETSLSKSRVSNLQNLSRPLKIAASEGYCLKT